MPFVNPHIICLSIIIFDNRSASIAVCYLQALRSSQSDASNWYNTLNSFITVEGICLDQLDGGIHTINIYMGACSDYFSPTQPSRLMSGSDSVPSHISIEEVRPGYAVDAGISIQCFNYILGRLHKILGLVTYILLPHSLLWISMSNVIVRKIICCQ